MAARLCLVDGSGFIFRAYHALPPLTRGDGTPVGAVMGFCNMVARLIETHAGDRIAIIFDTSRVSFRNEFYPDYKAHRPDPPDDLKPQFAIVRDATRAFDLPAIELAGFEADDLIATYARLAREAGEEVVIVSSDKDLMQLIGDVDGPNGPGRIDMLDTMKNQRIWLPEVEEKFGVAPELVGDVLALMGDSVDNVPGIFGIGPKTASKLIAEHGSLTAALDSAPAMKPSKLRDRLIEGRPDAELSKVLVTLKEDCDLPQPSAEMALGPVPPEPLAAFLEKHGFTSLLRRLDAGRGSPSRTTDLNPPKPSTAGERARVQTAPL